MTEEENLSVVACAVIILFQDDRKQKKKQRLPYQVDCFEGFNKTGSKDMVQYDVVSLRGLPDFGTIITAGACHS